MSQYNARKISSNVYWVGAIDNEIREFHGYGTPRGTTYNAYLILGKSPVLIDTVKKQFFTEMVARIKSILDPSKINYIISNHSEMDHSGALPESIELIKPEKVFASKNGLEALNQHFVLPMEVSVVKNGEEIILDDTKLKFIDTRMLHWPDSMFTYYANDNILFSQDAFGMHFATYNLSSAGNNREIMRWEAAKYFANILLPYSSLVLKLLQHIAGLGINIKQIAPDHGPIWDNVSDIQWITELWRQWASQQPTLKSVILYSTMWNSTKKMAEIIANSIAQNGVEIKIIPTAYSHRSDVITELLCAGALLVGSPILNQELYPTMVDVLSYIKGLKPKNLIGQAFGSYGWSSDALNMLTREMKDRMAINMVGDPIFVKYVPKQSDLVSCAELGKTIAAKLKCKIDG